MIDVVVRWFVANPAIGIGLLVAMAMIVGSGKRQKRLRRGLI